MSKAKEAAGRVCLLGCKRKVGILISGIIVNPASSWEDPTVHAGSEQALQCRLVARNYISYWLRVNSSHLIFRVCVMY